MILKNNFKLLIALLSVFQIGRTYGQTEAFHYEPYFAAIVVQDIATSSGWYQEVFDLEVKK